MPNPSNSLTVWGRITSIEKLTSQKGNDYGKLTVACHGKMKFGEGRPDGWEPTVLPFTILGKQNMARFEQMSVGDAVHIVASLIGKEKDGRIYLDIDVDSIQKIPPVRVAVLETADNGGVPASAGLKFDKMAPAEDEGLF